MVERNYVRERLNPYELEIYRTPPSDLVGDILLEEKMRILAREAKLDYFWGFYENGRWSSLKRFVYKTFIHAILKYN